MLNFEETSTFGIPCCTTSTALPERRMVRPLSIRRWSVNTLSVPTAEEIDDWEAKESEAVGRR
jgi:hypothetical protein